MSRNFFYMVMEAEGDLVQPFDDGGGADMPSEDIAPPATNDPSGEPPPLSDDGGGLDSMSFDDSGGGDDFGSIDDGGSGDGGGEDNDEADKKDTSLSDKANNILNQQLYQTIVNRNSEIEEILNNIKQLVPLLPMEVVNSNDTSIGHLKTALQKGQNYVLNDFVDAGYGENLLFYEKLNSIYTLLLNKIDSNLKKIKNKNQ